ncbi:MAG: NAD(P)-dependent glycerol-3-phosphate dehydrogenase [bacterium]|nr:NAD(P)-dependent glycerol-3-phosphate dehydrogenase [bacterium]
MKEYSGQYNGRIGVVGAGSWGTALAQLLASKGYAVDMWVYEKELCERMALQRENTFYLPGFSLHDNITPHSSLRDVVEGHDLLVMAVPSHVYRDVVTQMIPWLEDDVICVSATKGIENKTLLTMSGIWQELISAEKKSTHVSLAGPSFAREVMQEMPTVVTVASDDPGIARTVQNIFYTPNFRVYTSTDKIGVELAGALKNVIAIAAGACDGLGFGHNSRTALVTRGLAEITRLGVRMGANPLTFSGLSGVGDLFLTCTGDLSRNRTVGFRLGQGQKIKDILSEMRMVAEGVKTARSVFNLAKKMDVEMPVCEQVYRVLYEERDPLKTVRELMTRELRQELDFQYRGIDTELIARAH